tara:strand:+ start:2314 stop:2559 length:246 start_codon:yes stop_codon:yes gene_type:complete
MEQLNLKMLFLLRQFSFIFLFNISIFFILMIGIQNSSTRKKVDLIITETVELPISFIVGVGFISGSLTGSLLKINFRNQNG